MTNKKLLCKNFFSFLRYSHFLFVDDVTEEQRIKFPNRKGDIQMTIN